jgi:hypothetical protein
VDSRRGDPCAQRGNAQWWHFLVVDKAGAESTFELLGGTGHEGARFDRPASLAMTAAWLRTVLRK